MMEGNGRGQKRRLTRRKKLRVKENERGGGRADGLKGKTKKRNKKERMG